VMSSLSAQPRDPGLVYVRVEDVTPSVGSEEEIDLIDLWRILWRRKWIVFAFAAFFGMSGALYSLSATEWYRAEVLLSPAEQKGTQGLSGQLGGLARLAG